MQAIWIGDTGECTKCASGMVQCHRDLEIKEEIPLSTQQNAGGSATSGADVSEPPANEIRETEQLSPTDQTWSFTFFPSTSMVFTLKSMPVRQRRRGEGKGRREECR